MSNTALHSRLRFFNEGVEFAFTKSAKQTVFLNYEARTQKAKYLSHDLKHSNYFLSIEPIRCGRGVHSLMRKSDISVRLKLQWPPQN